MQSLQQRKAGSRVRHFFLYPLRLFEYCLRHIYLHFAPAGLFYNIIELNILYGLLNRVFSLAVHNREFTTVCLKCSFIRNHSFSLLLYLTVLFTEFLPPSALSTSIKQYRQFINPSLPLSLHFSSTLFVYTSIIKDVRKKDATEF